MRILVDADACPVVRQVEQCAKAREIPVMLFCDTNHVMSTEYSEVRIIGAGTDAVDLAIANSVSRGDLVVTQDYGLAALVLGRGARAIHQSGLVYHEDNIGGMLMDRYVHKRARMSSAKAHIKGPRKRTPEDDARFVRELEKLLDNLQPK